MLITSGDIRTNAFPLHNQTCRIRRGVSLKFSVKGVKMYDEDETVRMIPATLALVLCLCGLMLSSLSVEGPDGSCPTQSLLLHRTPLGLTVRLRLPQPGKRQRSTLLPPVQGPPRQSGEPVAILHLSLFICSSCRPLVGDAR